jgi:hypothetical protein
MNLLCAEEKKKGNSKKNNYAKTIKTDDLDSAPFCYLFFSLCIFTCFVLTDLPCLFICIALRMYLVLR